MTDVKKTVTFGAVTVDKVSASKFQKEGTLTAQVSQNVLIITDYPSAQVNNSLTQNIFNVEEFGFKSQTFEQKQRRVAFFDVPTNADVASVQKRIDETVEALGEGKVVLCIHRSCQPITHDGHKWALREGELTEDDLAMSQIVRDPETKKPILFEGKYQYRSTNFRIDGVDEVDNRKATVDQAYTSAMLDLMLAEQTA
jgi:hypothetical protein